MRVCNVSIITKLKTVNNTKNNNNNKIVQTWIDAKCKTSRFTNNSSKQGRGLGGINMNTLLLTSEK